MTEEIVVFTNGVFDLLHPGHIHLLEEARQMGTILYVGINSDASTKRLKGPSRPIYTQGEREYMLSSLKCINGGIFIFEEDTPEELIKMIKPDVLVKGGDYKIEDVVGRQYAKNVEIIPLLKEYSTTEILRRIKCVT